MPDGTTRTIASVKREDLVSALERVANIIEPRTTVPILGGVVLEARGGLLTVTGTNLDTEFSVAFPAEGEISVVALGHKTIMTAVRSSGAERVTLTQTERNLVVTAGALTLEVDTFPTSELPRIGFDAAVYEARFMHGDIIAAFRRVQPAISKEETRYYLNGVLLDDKDKPFGWDALAVATDGHRMYLHRIQAPAGIPHVIIPKRAIALILNHPTSSALNFEVSAKPVVRFSTTSRRGHLVTITTKTIDGKYPAYTRVVPDSTPGTATMDLAALRDAVDGLFPGEGHGVATRLHFEDGKLTVSQDARAAAGATLTSTLAFEGKVRGSLGLNVAYLQGALAQFGHKGKITFGFKGTEDAVNPSDPMLLSSETCPDFRALLMPMRL